MVGIGYYHPLYFEVCYLILYSCSFPFKVVKVANFVESPHSLEIPSRLFEKWPQTCRRSNYKKGDW
jgi:hypothetical protein